ncbi:MAG: bifunctional diaminohydroxyphosphoribosylaminopyrimidine deaminase/5-amino-6-(5-phosphoribosylamino)uracil reductase RibD [Brumimicrobium sp.]
MNKNNDIQFMQRALQLATLAGVNASPNPLVGAVIVYNDKIIGEGYHQKYGKAHAEVNAINAVKNQSILKDSTIYVTLEPCSHHGKTPPCADLIIKHQFKRVVIACLDTNSKVSGKGIERIKKNGLQVEVGLLEDEARFLNRRFFTFHEKKRPFVVLKWAETQDGFMDRFVEEREKGVNWITQPKTKLYVHQWRSKEQAILVGWKTVNNDNPQLTVREVEGKSPHRFIIDSNGNVNPSSTVFTDGNPTTIITTKKNIPNLSPSVEVISLTEVNVQNILSVLYEKKFLSVFIEGGAETTRRFIEENLWDEAYQLIGQSTFKKGLKAPTIKGKLLYDKNIGKDYLKVWQNQ